ncbi:MAG: sensor histidine kinase [Bacteroidales bacterium]|nr:sensor histidine kinase [Bacteroidales bacterium]MBN2820103.1 sensor histidine kinase [Bacteroidales bacterium]
MALTIALILSVVLQFTAAIIALSLLKRTKSNIAWWFLSLAFLLMAIRRLFEIFQDIDSPDNLTAKLVSTWMGVAISIIMLVSLLFIKRIFNVQKQIETLRKQNESRVLSAIIKTEEKERQYFAKELHDGLGPLLSSVKMALSTHNANAISTENTLLANTENLIDESIGSLKEISNKLSPHILNNFGIHKALKSFINKLGLQNGPSVHFKGNTEGERFSYNIEVVVYRVVCELLTNTLKYAQAKNVYIDLISEHNRLKVNYIDDGIGFDSDKLHMLQKGMGYANIESRIKSLDGQYNIYARPDEGVKVQIEIDLK